MKDLGKAIATFAIWGGVAVLSYLFNSFGILNGFGPVLMVFVAFINFGIYVVIHSLKFSDSDWSSKNHLNSPFFKYLTVR
ncbi:MAG TPA: hypothetical protein VI978_00285 [Candidatus Paceibacterota bacterium]